MITKQIKNRINPQLLISLIIEIGLFFSSKECSNIVFYQAGKAGGLSCG